MLRIATVQPLDRYRVSLTLTDHSKRIVDLAPHLQGDMFQPLREDPSLFRAVSVTHGTLSWPTGQDLDPDVLLGGILASRVANRWLKAMPSICEFDGIKVYVYGDDHNPPHIHAMHADDEALLRIDDGHVMKGALRSPQLTAVRKWMGQRRAEIALAWVQVQSGKAPDKVPPP